MCKELINVYACLCVSVHVCICVTGWESVATAYSMQVHVFVCWCHQLGGENHFFWEAKRMHQLTYGQTNWLTDRPKTRPSFYWDAITNENKAGYITVSHHPFKLPPCGFEECFGFSACLYSGWTSWTRIQLQRKLSCGAFWEKSKIENFSS